MGSRNYYRKRRSAWPSRLLMAALTVVIVFSGAQLIRYGVQQRQTQAVHQSLRDMRDEGAAASASPMPGQEPPPTSAPAAPDAGPAPVQQQALPLPTSTLEPWRRPPVLAEYQQLYARNNDLVGWLQMDRLYRVDFPIVQRDQHYYLRRDFDGNSNMNGTAFLDEGCSIWPRDDNLIIYAHNMRSGEMFGELHRLGSASYYRYAPITRFDTIYEQGAYVPVAAFLCTIAPGPQHFNFLKFNFADAAEFDRYMDGAKALSTIQTPYDVRYGDQLLTLVTCSDEEGKTRYVVILRRVRSDEDAQTLARQW